MVQPRPKVFYFPWISQSPHLTCSLLMVWTPQLVVVVSGPRPTRLRSPSYDSYQNLSRRLRRHAISPRVFSPGVRSLFNRINSQTVRTKYMTIDYTQLCASNVSWSAFNVNVVRRSQETQS